MIKEIPSPLKYATLLMDIHYRKVYDKPVYTINVADLLDDYYVVSYSKDNTVISANINYWTGLCFDGPVDYYLGSYTKRFSPMYMFPATHFL